MLETKYILMNMTSKCNVRKAVMGYVVWEGEQILNT